MKGLLLAVLVAGIACRDESATGPGILDVRWTGSDTGYLNVPATARWCASDSLVEITGAVGDSGVALAVLPRDTVAPGVFPVGIPTPARSRPSARIGLRWLGETLVEGYYSLDGEVTVDRGSDLNGSLEATLKSLNDGGQINMSGTFRRLRILPGSAESCGGGASAAMVPDSGIR